MTGRPEPSHQELRANLHKRMYLLEHGPGSRHGKRFNRHGVANVDAISTDNVAAGIAAANTGDSGISAGNSAAS